MAGTGLLETMARADLDALRRAVAADYRPGALETLARDDPGWCVALDRAEREAGALYQALRDADSTLARWRQAIGELHGLWSRVNQVPGEAEEASLEEVA